MLVPAVPLLDAELLEQHRIAHQRLADTYGDVHPSAQRLFRLQQRRIVIESLAHVRPLVHETDRQMLAVPPRAYLTSTEEHRMQGCTTLFRLLDTHVMMAQDGFIAPGVDRTLLALIHCMAESTAQFGHGKETTPGRFRTVLTKWDDQPVNFTHPPADRVNELMEAALAVANSDVAPACVRAAWTTFALLAIHPFVDGNGRSSRAMYMAVAAPGLPLGIDWGVLEQWSIWRNGYIIMNQRGQAYGRFEPAEMDALPFVEYATRTSTAGATVCRDRVLFLDQLLAELHRCEIPETHAMVLAFLRLWRIATLDELGLTGYRAFELDQAIAELIDAGLIRWADRPHSRRTSLSPEPMGLVAV